MDNEIADIIQDFEGWIETLNDNPYEGAGRDFADFCYDKMPKVVDAFKQYHQEQSTSTPGIIT